jgi:hypothetical protein
MRMSGSLLTICAVAGVAGVAGVAHAADPVPVVETPPVKAAAIRRVGAISVDGDLDEPGWKNAPVSTGFWQRFPEEGKPPQHRTEFRVLYDDTALYVGVRAHDVEPEKIKRMLTRRDEMSSSDWLMVAVDSYHDKRTAFVFGVNAANVQRDWLVFDDISEDTSWDAVWTAGAKVDADGWCAEFRIPLSQLRFSSEPEQQWGLQVMRQVGRTGEQNYWAPMPKAENRVVSLFGTLDGLSGVKPGRRLELLPYISGGAAFGTLDDSNPFDDSVAARGNVGIDVRYGLGSAFTLAASINPDFGQIEADPSQVNLGANELFFPEKRPFFLEGGDIFKFGLGLGDGNAESLFYSRRIGASPHGSPSGDYADIPQATTIYGAAKISGKARGWSIGLLDAVTAEEEATVETAGERHTEVVEPLTNFALLRVKRDFRDGGTQVGGILTAVHRKLDGTPTKARLHDAGYTGGAEIRHRFASQAWNFRAKVMGTYVHGDPAAIEYDQRQIRHLYQRPDANYVELDPTRTSLTGYGATGSIGRDGKTKHWRWNLAYEMRSPGFEANDLGFQQGGDNIVGSGWLQYREDTAGDTLLQYNLNANLWGWSDFEPQFDGYGGNINGWGQLKNHWSLGTGVGADVNLWDLAKLRGGPAIRGEVTPLWWVDINSDDRKRVKAYFGLWGNHTPAANTHRAGGSVGVTIDARPNIGVYLGPSVEIVSDDAQYVDEVTDAAGMPHYIFAKMHEVIVGMVARTSWTLSPRLSLQVYAQPFIAAGDYREYRETSDVRAENYRDRYHELRGPEIMIDREAGEARVDRDQDGATDYSFGLGDFNFRQLRSNVVLRWEYLPGSTAFLIWSHGQTDFETEGRFGTGGLSRGLSGLFDAPSEDVVMIKVNYWVGL